MRRFTSCLFLMLSLSGFSQSGIVWGPVTDVATSASDNEHPRISLDGNGDPMVAWGDAPNLCQFSRWNGSAFTSPVILNPLLPVFVYSWAGPEIASKGDTVYVVYKQNSADTGHIYLTRSFDGGYNFDSPVQVDLIGDSLSDFPTVGVDLNGQPLVGYMRYDSGYVNTRWVLSRSTDFGSTFLPDILASAASGGEVCDCCPASLVASDSNVAFLYRGNVSNMRDNWVAISDNNGASFAGGMNIDQHNWMLMSCPSSGPDGVIVDDTLYSVFMNGASGTRVFTNKNHLGTFSSSAGTPVTAPITGLTQQNYPRIAASGTAVVQAWRQVIGTNVQLALLFTENIHAGFPAAFDTIVSGNGAMIVNTDVAVSSDAVHVIWQNNSTGTIKYRKGFFGPAGLSDDEQKQPLFVLHPNPAKDHLLIRHSFSEAAELTIYGIAGNVVQQCRLRDAGNRISLETVRNGSYYVCVVDGEKTFSRKLIVVH